MAVRHRSATQQPGESNLKYTCLAHLLNPDLEFLRMLPDISGKSTAASLLADARSLLPSSSLAKPSHTPHSAVHTDTTQKALCTLTATSDLHCRFMSSKLSALVANPSLCQFVSPSPAPPRAHKGTLDSGSEVHLFTYEAAMQLFTTLGISKLRVVGINGVPKSADVEGKFILTLKGPSGNLFRVDLGPLMVRNLETHTSQPG